MGNNVDDHTRILNYKRKHPEASVHTLAKNLHIPSSVVRTILGEIPPQGKGMEEDELLLKFDKETQVRRKLDDWLAEGIIGYWPEAQVREFLGESNSNHFARAIKDPKYNKFKFILGGKIIWAAPENVNKMVAKYPQARNYVGEQQ